MTNKKDLLILDSLDIEYKKVLVFDDKELFDELEEYILRVLDANEVDFKLERYELRDGEHFKLYFNDEWDDKEYAFEKVQRALKEYYNVRFPVR